MSSELNPSVTKIQTVLLKKYQHCIKVKGRAMVFRLKTKDEDNANIDVYGEYFNCNLLSIIHHYETADLPYFPLSNMGVTSLFFNNIEKYDDALLDTWKTLEIHEQCAYPTLRAFRLGLLKCATYSFRKYWKTETSKALYACCVGGNPETLLSFLSFRPFLSSQGFNAIVNSFGMYMSKRKWYRDFFKNKNNKTHNRKESNSIKTMLLNDFENCLQIFIDEGYKPTEQDTVNWLEKQIPISEPEKFGFNKTEKTFAVATQLKFNPWKQVKVVNEQIEEDIEDIEVVDEEGN